MNVFAKSDKIPSMILQDIEETKRYGRTHGWTVGQRENSIPAHKHSLRGYNQRIREVIPVPDGLRKETTFISFSISRGYLNAMEC